MESTVNVRNMCSENDGLVTSIKVKSMITNVQFVLIKGKKPLIPNILGIMIKNNEKFKNKLSSAMISLRLKRFEVPDGDLAS